MLEELDALQLKSSLNKVLRSLFLTGTVKNLTRLASKLLVLCLSIMMFLMKNL